MNLLPLDNAILKLKHNGLLILILTCAASNDLNPVDCCLGSASGDGLPLQKFQVSVRTKKCNCHSVTNNCHNWRFLTEVSVNGGVALKT